MTVDEALKVAVGELAITAEVSEEIGHQSDVARAKSCREAAAVLARLREELPMLREEMASNLFVARTWADKWLARLDPPEGSKT